MSITQYYVTQTFERVRNFYEKYDEVDDEQEGIIQKLNKHVISRLGFFAATPGIPLAASADLMGGTCAAAASILTLGRCKDLNKVAFNMTKGGGEGLLSKTYHGLLLFLNQEPEFNYTTDKNTHQLHHKDGIITDLYLGKLKDIGNNLSNSDNIFLKHVLSRITFLGCALIPLVTRVIDLVIGLIAAPLSLLTVGKFKHLNSWAHDGLMAPKIINDFYFGIMKTINPWAFRP